MNLGKKQFWAAVAGLFTAGPLGAPLSAVSMGFVEGNIKKWFALGVLCTPFLLAYQAIVVDDYITNHHERLEIRARTEVLGRIRDNTLEFPLDTARSLALVNRETVEQLSIGMTKTAVFAIVGKGLKSHDHETWPDPSGAHEHWHWGEREEGKLLVVIFTDGRASTIATREL